MPSAAETVCVTGANGYIAGFIVEQLLCQGYIVHATVRDPGHPKNNFLLELARKNGAETRLKLFKSDLTIAGSFDDAFCGCSAVIHTAAVVTLTYKCDPFDEIINPVVKGVENVVNSCLLNGVRRLVYTSSVATIACHDDFRPIELRGTPFTEDVWLTHVTPTYGTYNYAKIAAEKRLMEIWPSDRELVCILPSWTVGPQQSSSVTSSNQIVKLIAGNEKSMLPRLYFDMVDVRDVAGAHVWALDKRVPNGRYNVTGNRNNSTAEIAKMIMVSYPEMKLKTRMAPYWLLWTISWFDKRISTQMLRERTEHWAPISNERVKRFGFVFKHTSLVDTLRDAVESMKRLKLVPS